VTDQHDEVTPESEPTRVFLLDDHEIVRRGVADLLNQEPDMTVVGEAAAAAKALSMIEACNPDVAVLDVRLGDGNGIEVCREVRSHFPDVACLMLTSFSDDQAFIDAAMAGAAGYVLKQIGSNDLIESIRKVAAGSQLLDRAEVRLRMDRMKRSEDGALLTLTPQEQRIFELIGEGFSNRQIADELYLAEKTVKNYISNLFAKLGIARRTQAAAMAARFDERQKRRFN
jgi:DNA-binding NarL/FixJ family response regulator